MSVVSTSDTSGFVATRQNDIHVMANLNLIISPEIYPHISAHLTLIDGDSSNRGAGTRVGAGTKAGAGTTVVPIPAPAHLARRKPRDRDQKNLVSPHP